MNHTTNHVTNATTNHTTHELAGEPIQGPGAAVDFGISNTDVVTNAGASLRCWSLPSGDRPPDPARLREVLAAGGLTLTDLHWVAVTGGRHQLLPSEVDGRPIVRVNEIEAVGRGGQALAGLAGQARATPLLVVSAGSGTALAAARGHDYAHVTGSGVGGGTLIGLGRLLLGTADPAEIDALAQVGDPNRVDLSLADVVSGPIGNLPPDATAVNFGRAARESLVPGRADLAAALVALVGQVIGIVAVNAARAQRIGRIVVIGHLIDMPSVRRVLDSVGLLYQMELEMPPEAGHATALGALLTVGERA